MSTCQNGNGRDPIARREHELLDTIREAPNGRPYWYKLADDGRTPIPATPREGEALLHDSAARRVGFDRLGRAGHVSTVFLALDHSFFGGEPVLFETLVFGGRMDGYMVRATSWTKAHGNHQRVVGLLCRTMQPAAKRLRGWVMRGHRYDRGSNSQRGGA